uniref:Putative ovule protein n=1 Tax=Solanum chacoense TaxID=4108 RepID=A0A0V0IQG4_SOLCH
MVGVIDEIRMPKGQSDVYPMLVDTKTRVQASLPREPQRRNGRLQLMCYKHLWDSLVANDFPPANSLSSSLLLLITFYLHKSEKVQLKL